MLASVGCCYSNEFFSLFFLGFLLLLSFHRISVERHRFIQVSEKDISGRNQKPSESAWKFNFKFQLASASDLIMNSWTTFTPSVWWLDFFCFFPFLVGRFSNHFFLNVTVAEQQRKTASDRKPHLFYVPGNRVCRNSPALRPPLLTVCHRKIENYENRCRATSIVSN